MKRIKMFFKRVVEALAKTFKAKPIQAVIEWVKDPDLDIVGVGVFSTLLGRVVLFGSFMIAYVSAGAWFSVTLLVALMAYDTMTHFQVLAALRKLMRYEIVEEMISFSQAA